MKVDRVLGAADSELIAWLESQNVECSVNDVLAELTRRRVGRVTRWTLLTAIAAAIAAVVSAAVAVASLLATKV